MSLALTGTEPRFLGRSTCNLLVISIMVSRIILHDRYLEFARIYMSVPLPILSVFMHGSHIWKD